jgi:hypothetical protein
MSHWKNLLCLAGIFAAYGLAGHLDFEDEVALDHVRRADLAEAASAQSRALAPEKPQRAAFAVAASDAAQAPAHPKDRR